jgi:hypothetical protein
MKDYKEIIIFLIILKVMAFFVFLPINEALFFMAIFSIFYYLNYKFILKPSFIFIIFNCIFIYYFTFLIFKGFGISYLITYFIGTILFKYLVNNKIEYKNSLVYIIPLFMIFCFSLYITDAKKVTGKLDNGDIEDNYVEDIWNPH